MGGKHTASTVWAVGGGWVVGGGWWVVDGGWWVVGGG